MIFEVLYGYVFLFSEMLHYRNDCYCYMSVRYCTIEMTAIVI